MNNFWNTRCILKVIVGSHAYGTNVKTSDKDYCGICIPPENYLLGLDQFEQYERKEPDEVIYSLEKFVRLALQNNPNIIDMLFADDKHIVLMNEFGYELRNIRYAFLSKRVFKTYGGYAVFRLKNLTEKGKNPIGTKKDLIEKYGFDTKDASHLIRLIHMAIEILEEGEVLVYRPDRQYLLDIRNGKFTLDEIKEEYERLNELLKTAYSNSKLPDEPNYNQINKWLVEVHKRALYHVGEPWDLNCDDDDNENKIISFIPT